MISLNCSFMALAEKRLRQTFFFIASHAFMGSREVRFANGVAITDFVFQSINAMGRLLALLSLPVLDDCPSS